MLAFIKCLLLPTLGSEYVFSSNPPIVPAIPGYRLETWGSEVLRGTHLATGGWRGWREKHEAAL